MSLVLSLDRYGDGLDLEREVLGPLGVEVRLAAADAERRSTELAESVGLLVVDHPVDEALLAIAPACRAVATYGIGVDNIDLDAARRAAIVVANVPGYCEDEVAEHTLGLWLACERRIARGDASVRVGGWERAALRPMRRLRGLTFGLVGFGRIARQVATRVQGFGVSVVAFDPAVHEVDDAFGYVALAPDLPALLSRSDVVSIHIPLDATTAHLIDAQAIALMRPDAVLINTARGGLIDQAALLAALRDGRLGGAALDVLAEEPPEEPLDMTGLNRLVLTPHVAFESTEAVAAAKRGAAGAIASVLRGDRVDGRVA